MKFFSPQYIHGITYFGNGDYEYRNINGLRHRYHAFILVFLKIKFLSIFDIFKIFEALAEEIQSCRCDEPDFQPALPLTPP